MPDNQASKAVVLRTRAISATFFVIAVLVGLYSGPMIFTMFWAFVTGVCLYEYGRMCFGAERKSYPWRRSITMLLGMSVYLGLAYYRFSSDEPLPTEVSISQFAFVFMLPLLLLIIELFRGSSDPFRGAGLIVFGVVYIGVPFTLLQYIYAGADRNGASPNLILGILLLVWANDTFAYLVGSRIGRTPLLPRISPKKTWEGSIGGVICTIATGGILHLAFGEISLLHWMSLAGIVAVFGSFGDLVESMLKRSVGVKDSGRMMPGHGGLLDRFDAFLFVVPFAFAYLFWAVW